MDLITAVLRQYSGLNSGSITANCGRIIGFGLEEKQFYAFGFPFLQINNPIVLNFSESLSQQDLEWDN